MSILENPNYPGLPSDFRWPVFKIIVIVALVGINPKREQASPFRAENFAPVILVFLNETTANTVCPREFVDHHLERTAQSVAFLRGFRNSCRAFLERKAWTVQSPPKESMTPIECDVSRGQLLSAS